MEMRVKAALFAGVSLLLTPGARGQEAAATPSSAELDNQGGITDIIVTARRRNESLLETPVAVTAFDAAELERRRITAVSDIQSSTPSLVYESTGGNSSEARMFIRGVGNASSNVSSEQGVGLYIDGAYFSRAQGAMLDNLDIASIEVLRGPQGTLFGKNTIGGAINITTIKPSTDAFSGSLEAGYGRFDRVRVRGTVNIPLGDMLAVRLAGMRDRDDGYSVNDFDGRRLDNRDTWVGSGALRFTPTDNLTWDVSAMYSRDRNHGRGFQCVQLANSPVLGPAFTAACAATNANGIRHARSDIFLKGYMDMFALSNTLAWDIGQVGVIDDLTIKAIGSYQWIKSQRVLDYDATTLRGVHTEELGRQNRQISGELQILGQAFDRRLNFVFGAYADRERTPGAGARYTSVYPSLEALGSYLSFMGLIKLHNRSHAFYSQVTYDFSPIISLTGGLRYTQETKGFYAQRYSVSDFNRNVRIGNFTTNGLYTRDFSTWTPMASLQLNAPEAWTENGFLDKGMLYLTYSKGFKGGGFNGNGDATARTLTSFEPEKVDNYEVGLKFSMFDRRLIGSISGYEMRYRDIQLNVTGVSPTSPAPINSTFNAGGARTKGVEIELQALLLDSLRLSFNGDFSNPRYTRFDDRSVPGGSRVGEPLAYIPDYRLSGAIENRFTLGGEMALTPRAQITRTGERYLITDKSPAVREVGRVPAFNLVDASVKLDLNDHVSFDFYGKNIFNKKYKNDAVPNGFLVLTWYGAPVTYGVIARVKF
jgi:iron complex outermembrane receptor protein